ncbi:MAG: metallophosphoesterase [Rhodospirillaceae bacterium]|nr:metallophosphoesterase [Rhodospirillaceae bacterium]
MKLSLTLCIASIAVAALPGTAASQAGAVADRAGATTAGPQPWTHRDFLNDPANFTFAVVSDLTGGERNGIFDVAVADLNLLAPEFVMSVGDLIEGYTEDEVEINRQWDTFDRKVGGLDMPFFYAAGNHDFSNPRMRDVWAQRRGNSYYHFVYKDVLFLVLNSEDWGPTQYEQIVRNFKDKAQLLNSQDYWEQTLAGIITGFISEKQVAYFESAIAENPKVRWTFLFMHTPMWQGDGSKEYWRIEASLKGRPFTAFAGHVHQYRKSVIDGMVHIRLGTTGGVFLEEHQVSGKKFDHVTLVSVVDDKPRIVNLRLDGILNEDGEIPAGGEDLKFSKD